MRHLAPASAVALLLAGVLVAACAPSRPPGASAAASAPASVSAFLLVVRVPGARDLELSLADLEAMPRRTIEAQERDGKAVSYSGVTIQDILARAGVDLGETLRGPRLREHLLVEASDGYGAVFALPELSSAFTDRVVLAADTADGLPLSEKDGPVKIIIPGEKKRARWVRNVTTLTVR